MPPASTTEAVCPTPLRHYPTPARSWLLRRLGQVPTRRPRRTAWNICSPSPEIPHDVKVYAGVGHDFMNDHDPADQTLMLRFLARTSGTKYDEDATHDARRRAFFDRHQKDEQRRPTH